jgi:hypothetical protein
VIGKVSVDDGFAKALAVSMVSFTVLQLADGSIVRYLREGSVSSVVGLDLGMTSILSARLH